MNKIIKIQKNAVDGKKIHKHPMGGKKKKIIKKFIDSKQIHKNPVDKKKSAKTCEWQKDLQKPVDGKKFYKNQ